MNREESVMLDLGWPQPFTGSAEERQHNFRTHRWASGHDARCVVCDAKAGTATSFWPCGVEPPRMHRDGTVTMLTVPHDLIDSMAVEREREPWQG